MTSVSSVSDRPASNSQEAYQQTTVSSRFSLRTGSPKFARLRRQNTVVLCIWAGVFAMVWGVEVVYVGFPTHPYGFFVTGFFLLVTALLLGAAVYVSRGKEPISLSVDQRAISLSYRDGSVKSLPWERTSFNVRIHDQRHMPMDQWVTDLSPTSANFWGLAIAVPLPEEAVGTILDSARNHGMIIRERTSHGGRRQPASGTTVISILASKPTI